MINNPKLKKLINSRCFSLKHLKLLEELEEKSVFCRNCKTKRELVEFVDLPEEEKERFTTLQKLHNFGDDSTFFYYKKCNEFSMQSNPEFG